MDLDQYGAGCRCLLRIRENLGNPMISDETFIADHRGVYADWTERPGAADVPRLFELADELGIASGGEVFRNYDQVLSRHRAGNAVVIRTERELRRAASDEPGAEQFALVIEMDDLGLNLWAPASDGSSEVVSRTRAEFWEAELAAGIVLYPPKVAEAKS